MKVFRNFLIGRLHISRDGKVSLCGVKVKDLEVCEDRRLQPMMTEPNPEKHCLCCLHALRTGREGPQRRWLRDSEQRRAA